MNSSTNKCLLAIEPYKFTGEQIASLREKYKGQWYDNNKYLPTYCIKNNGRIGLSEHYHQFTDGLSKETYILFDIYTADKLLQEELDNCGFEGKYGILSDVVDWEQIVTGIIKDKFEIYLYDDYKRSLISAQYLVIQLHYYRCSYEYNEWDSEFTLLGYLDKDLKLNEFEYIS